MKISRWLIAGAAVLTAAGGGLYWLTRPPESITVVSWGDVYGRAQTIALLHPFTETTGVEVRIANYGGGLREISDQVRAENVEWDVVDLEWEDAAEACRVGLLERLDGIALPAGSDGTVAERDFVPGALGPCWVGSVVYAQVIAFPSARFAQDERPASAADFFDLARFPGPRGLRDNGPKYNLELALMADGVPAGDVYAMLATPSGVERAFAKLDTIKPAIQWWNRTAEPADMLAQGAVAMTTTLNARVFSSDAEPEFRTIWDGQLYQLDVFGVPKGTRKRTRAFAFLRFATGSGPLAEEARYLPYGPARRSAVALVGRNPETGAEMRPYLPTAPQNFAHALAVDPDWWASHGGPLEARWAAWRKE